MRCEGGEGGQRQSSGEGAAGQDQRIAPKSVLAHGAKNRSLA